MSTVETNLVQPSTGTTLTLGASGDTVTIPSGATIDASAGTAAGFGKVLQVVSAGTTAYVGSSTSTYVDTSLTVTITPASTSNKILILGTQADCFASSVNSANSIHMRLMRDATEILDICDRALLTASALENMGNISFNYLDSPSLDVAITYKTQFHNQGAYANVAVQQQQQGRSTITVMEIEA